MTVSVDLRVGATFGKYEITGVLGKGGMGEVFEAYDNQIGRAVALKIIKSQFADDDSYRTRFERESRAVAKLQEPHVIPIHGCGEIDGCLFIDMRLVRGADLQSLIENGPLDPDRSVDIIGQVAAALDAAHAEGLIHRDVKPQNVIVTAADFAYLVDFGIAEVVGGTRLTMAGFQIGSWPYMAPERFSDQNITRSVDVYALTCVLYESLTGQLPFPVESQQALYAAHLTAPPPRPSAVNPRVSPTLDRVIARGMAKDPKDRYESAGALAHAAKQALRADREASLPTAHSAPAQMPKPDPCSSSHPRISPNPYASPDRYTPNPPAPANPYASANPYPPANPYPSWPPTPQVQLPPQASAPSGPLPVVYGPAKDVPRWAVPSIVAICAAVVLTAVGVIVGYLAKLNSPSEPTAAPMTAMTYPSAAESTTAESQSPRTPSVAAPTVPAVGTPPPLVTGPDQTGSHQTCDAGYQAPGETGFASHSGRGSIDTSCVFSQNVLLSYWSTYGSASLAPRTVSAVGAVPCNTVSGASCDPRNPANFLMQCGQDGTDNWLRCIGGKDAVVYLW